MDKYKIEDLSLREYMKNVKMNLSSQQMIILQRTVSPFGSIVM